MPYEGLKDGGLSVKIDGVERVTEVHGLETETTSNGDGGGSFWMEPADPFNPRGTWDELRVGAPVDVTHTYDAATTQMYKGFVISDPKAGMAGETKRLQVECGGALEVARWRQDVGFVYTDSDTDQWFEYKKNPKWASVDISDAIEIRVEEGTKVPPGKTKAAIVGYICYEGAEYLYKGHTPAGPLNGVKRMDGHVTTNLEDGMRAGIYWAPIYKQSYDSTDFPLDRSGTVKFYDSYAERHLGNSKGGKYEQYMPIGGGNGAGYVFLAMWNASGATVEMKKDRFVRIDNPELFTVANEYRVDQAMLDVAGFIGLHDSSDTDEIGSVLQNLVARPPTDPISALNTFVQQADVPVEWGWFSYYSGGSKYQFRAKRRHTDPDWLRFLGTCYGIDAEAPGVTWDVRQHPEDGSNWKGLRFRYGRLGRSDYPAGFPDAAFAPGSGASWGDGVAFMGAMARVLSVDFTGHNYSPQAARKLARRLWKDLGCAQSSGTCQLRVATVPDRVTPTTLVPAPYIKGGDAVECWQSNCGPLPVTRSHIDYDSETVDLEVGIEEEALIEQLEAAGAIRAVTLAKHRRKGWRSKR